MSYTPEEQAAAWAAYYAQQGYVYPDASASTSTAAYAPTHIPPSAVPGSSSSSYGYNAPSNGYRAPYDPDMAQQASAYMPSAPPMGGGGGGPPGFATGSNGYNPNAHGIPFNGPGGPGGPGGPPQLGPDGKPLPAGKKQAQGKRDTVIRKKGGLTWEDQTLLEWDESWFRLFVGDLSNDVSENTLNSAFSKYPSYQKSKVVRDRLSMKAKYGFIAFKDPEDFLKAWKEMDGKYVGNRPIRLMKCNAEAYGGTRAVSVGTKKAKELDKLAKNKGKPLNGRPTAW